MAFGDRIKNFGKKLGKIDPFTGRLLGGDKDDRKKYAPQKQYAGGSEAASKRQRAEFAGGTNLANDMVARSEERANKAAYASGKAYDQLRGTAAAGQNVASSNAEAAGRLADQGLGDYRSGRQASLSNAAAMEQFARNAPNEYQQTAQRQFAAQQDANTRNALALGATGGPSGLRAALASSTAANAQAANQAQMTQANEYNQLLGMRNDALANASNVRQNQGSQDLSAAGQSAQREQAARASQLGWAGAENQAVAGKLGAQMGTAQLAGNLGTASRGQYLGARSSQDASELDAARAAEAQRQGWEREEYTKQWMPLRGLFNSPSG